jgi:exodeoxyribonuclease V beta subunit
VAPEQRLNELEFYLPIGKNGSFPAGDAQKDPAWLELVQRVPLDRLTRVKLSRAFSEFPSAELVPSYPELLKRLQFLPVEGYLKGYIDLVVVHDGRFYVIDYKTNHLGNRRDDYAREHLPEAMAESHYYLQYHLYALALHRYLGQRRPGYSYDAHFGGAYYLFLKGMDPASGPDYGIFFERPPRERIERLSALFADPAAFRGSHAT